MDIKMIVTDLDGTLLCSNKNISERLEKALLACRRKGIKIACATGRGPSVDLKAPSHLFDAKISNNGAVARIKDERVYYRPVPWQIARPMLIEFDKRGYQVSVEQHYNQFTNFDPSDNDTATRSIGFTISDFSTLEEDAEKIYIPLKGFDVETETEFINSLLPNSLWVTVCSINQLVQIMHKDATKAKATAALANIWGIDSSNIVAFGDDFNDVDMFDYAGVSVAMGNAIDQVKAVADYICDTNDNDGMAKWLEENVRCVSNCQATTLNQKQMKNHAPNGKSPEHQRLWA